MKYRLFLPILLSVFVTTSIISMKTNRLYAQDHEFIFGDLLPDAPELAKKGNYQVGVKTIDLLHKNQADIINIKNGKAPLYDRPIKVEIWYPGVVPDGQEEITEYEQVLGRNGTQGRPVIPFKFKGRALRDAAVLKETEKYPLVILSHGYVGSRYLFTYLAENLASKGYVVVSIDHTDSTYKDAAAFTSTLANRALDQLFVLDEMDRLSKPGSNSFLSGLVDADNTAIIGYSMGGYGVLNVAGAGYSQTAVTFFKSITGGSNALDKRVAGNTEYPKVADTRIKAIVALAPWGMANNVWDAEGLKGLKTPTFFVCGSEDDISMYDTGVKAIYEGTVNADRYLLTYINARHNVAPNPPANVTFQEGLNIDEYLRYADSVWDMRRINNVNQHFITAFLGIHLKAKDYSSYLDLKENATTGNWKGFKPRTSIGMELRHAKGQ